MLIINKRVTRTKDKEEKEDLEEAEEEAEIIGAMTLTDQDHVPMVEVINYWL